MRVCPRDDQVLDRQAHSHPVVGRGRADRELLLAPVHEHELDAGLEQRVVQPVVAPRGCGDDPVDLPRAHGLGVEQLALGIVVGVGDQRGVPRCLETVLDAAQDRREERVREVRDQDPDRVGAVRLQPPGDRIRLVAELLGRAQHPPRGLVVHERAGLLVQRSGYRGRVDAGHPGDISQRHSRAGSHVRGRHPRALCRRLQCPLTP